MITRAACLEDGISHVIGKNVFFLKSSLEIYISILKNVCFSSPVIPLLKIYPKETIKDNITH